MIKEAIEKILSLHPNPVQRINVFDREFVNAELKEITPPEKYEPKPIRFSQLSGLISFAKGLKTDDPLMIAVSSPSMIVLQGELQAKNFNKRFVYATAELNFSLFNFGKFMTLEEAVIGIQSLFYRDDNCEAVLDLLSNIVDESLVTLEDSGMSQTVNVKTGITTKSKVTVPKTVTAAPYRTFPEVVQPSSTFILRFRKSGGGLTCAMFEADGNAWKIQAVDEIKRWIETELEGKADIPVIA